MLSSWFKLAIACLLGPTVAFVLQWAEKHTRYANLKYGLRQLITGVIFGGLAILGTEWGIAINGAQVNCRDGAVLIAGLFFSGPAGILAGLIGGIERWIAVAWGNGTSHTRITTDSPSYSNPTFKPTNQSCNDSSRTAKKQSCNQHRAVTTVDLRTIDGDPPFRT